MNLEVTFFVKGMENWYKLFLITCKHCGEVFVEYLIMLRYNTQEVNLALVVTFSGNHGWR